MGDKGNQRTQLDGLHRRVVQGDYIAADELCAVVLADLPRRVRAASRGAERDAVDTASDDALLVYLRNPRRYDPRRAALMTWLERIAIRRLIDLQRSRGRRLARELAGMEITEPFATSGADDAESAKAWIAERRAVLLAATRTVAEHAFVKARLTGSSRGAQAVALGVAHLPASRARAEMNRVWELIVRRARRRQRRTADLVDRKGP